MQLGIESPRYVDRAEDGQTGTIADLDLAGSYRVTPSLDVVARLENVGASFERYPGYERPPTTISAGVRIHW
jgi:outer membrane cobalamin receptor